MGGVYAKRRGRDPARWELTIAHRVHGEGVSSPVAPCCAGIRGLHGAPHHCWAPPDEPPVQYGCDLSLTDDAGQAPLHPDLCATASDPSGARTTLGDEPSQGSYVDASPASGVDSGPSRPRTASSTDSRRLGHEAHTAPVRRPLVTPPCVQDGTERPIQRPKDPADQAEYYRGKQTCHTLKNLLVLNATCDICFLSNTGDGKASDTIMAELTSSTVPPGSCLSQETGCQGCFRHGVTIVQPKNTPRGGELTPPEKKTNRRISSIRIRIEQAMGGVQRDRIVKDNIRLLKDGMRDAVMETCCGLPNFRLQYRPWHYAS